LIVNILAKSIIATILLFMPLNELNKIAKINEHKKAAEEAYLADNFEKAAYHYGYLVDSLGVNEENILLNLANALYKVNDTLASRNYYNQLIVADAGAMSKSLAHGQLGLLDFNSSKYQEALVHYKSALKLDPTNEDARYNYELLKKLLEEQKKQQEQEQEQQQDQQNQDQEQQNQDQQNQENQDQENQQEQQDQQNQENQENQQQQQEQQEGEEQEQKEGEESEQQQDEDGEESEEQPEDNQPTTAEKLEEMNISEEKAQMILEAMKNNEIQYIQQNRRKAKNRKKSGKPDW